MTEPAPEAASANRARKLMRLGYLWGALLLTAVLCWQLGATGILYGFYLLVAYVVISLLAGMVMPRANALDDPIYKQNVQRWVDRAARGEG
jgi:hypothetical protein